MINVVIPMAGRGSRFTAAGYTIPKPLIEIDGRPMIELVTENVRPAEAHRFIYICLKEHMEEYDLQHTLEKIAPGCIVIPVDHVTEGAACTVLLAEEYINTDERMMIANSDQLAEYPIDEYLKKEEGFDGLIMTVKAKGTNFSFIQYDQEDRVTLIREKEQISDEATVGIYNFARGKDYVTYADRMIRQNMRINGEFYVAPVYNLLIEDGKRIAYCNIGKFAEAMRGLGTPEELNAYLEYLDEMQKKTGR